MLYSNLLDWSGFGYSLPKFLILIDCKEKDMDSKDFIFLQEWDPWPHHWGLPNQSGVVATTTLPNIVHQLHLVVVLLRSDDFIDSKQTGQLWLKLPLAPFPNICNSLNVIGAPFRLHIQKNVIRPTRSISNISILLACFDISHLNQIIYQLLFKKCMKTQWFASCRMRRSTTGKQCETKFQSQSTSRNP